MTIAPCDGRRRIFVRVGVTVFLTRLVMVGASYGGSVVVMGWNFTSNIDGWRYSGSHHFGSSVTYRYDSEDGFPCDDLIGTWKGARRDAFYYPSYPNAPLGNKYYEMPDG